MVFARARLPNWLHGLLVAAVLWAPLWGQWHGIAHGPGPAFSAAIGPHEAHALEHHGHKAHEHASHGHAAHADHGHSDPLGHAAKADLCQVLDHLAQAERLTPSHGVGSAPRVAPQPPIFCLFFSPDRLLWSTAQARAPPVLI